MQQTAIKTRTSLETRNAHVIRTVVWLGFHATALLAFWSGWSWGALAFCAVMYYSRAMLLTGGVHRYLAHKCYRTSRAVQFLMALGATTALQKGVLWWAAHHRNHHTHSDTPQDVHSQRHRGFYYAHMGWIADPKTDATPYDKIPDLVKFPELVWLNHNYVFVYTAFCALTYFTLGFQFLVWGCFVSTILLWHGTFTINSLCHMFGKRVYRTHDDSRNSFLLAVVSAGEGWHNNHHFYQASAHQAFHWWQFDPTWYVLLVLEKLGVIWDVRRTPQSVIDGNLGGKNHLVSVVGDHPLNVPESEWPSEEPALEVSAPAVAIS